MPAWRRDQGRQTLDQFEWGQHQADAAARSRLDALIDQVLGIDFTQPFQREGRPGAVAQQALQAQAIVRFDAHAGIERETPTVIPGAHRRGVFAFEHSAAGENAQQTVAHLGLNLGDGFGTDAPGFVKAHAACAIGLENPLDHDAVEVDVGIEQGAEAVDEGDRADPGGWTRPRAALAQALLHRTEEDVQRQGLHGRIVLQEVAQALGHRQHPLAHRQPRHDVIGEMRCGLDHAPGVAGRAHAAPLAREGDQEVVLTLLTESAGETVGEDAAFEVAAKFPLHIRGHRFGVEVPLAGEREIGLEMALDDAVERRALGATPAVDSAADLTCLRAVHGTVTSGW